MSDIARATNAVSAPITAPTLDNIPLRAFCSGVSFPHRASTKICIAVVAKFGSARESAEELRVTTAENHIIGDEGKFELRDAKANFTLPNLSAQSIGT